MRMELFAPRQPVRLSRSRRITIKTIGSGVWLTGVLWLVFHYFLQRQGDFGPTPHPLEFWWRAAHGFFGFAALWTLGLLWAAHIVGAWNTGRHRASGIAAFAVLTWLSLSGYLLYYLSGDALLAAVSIAHWGVGLALPAIFLIHRLAPVLARTRKPRLDSDDGSTEGLV